MKIIAFSYFHGALLSFKFTRDDIEGVAIDVVPNVTLPFHAIIAGFGK